MLLKMIKLLFRIMSKHLQYEKWGNNEYIFLGIIMYRNILENAHFKSDMISSENVMHVATYDPDEMFIQSIYDQS